jgi:hypothetical protein
MAFLAGGQILLGVPAMGGRSAVAVVDGVGSGERPAGMTGGGTVIGVSVAGGKTAWCCG